MGRITTYTQEKAEAICEKLSQGIPLAVICREDENMPAVRTVSLWKKDHPEFGAMFARARDDGYDALAAQCLEIADTPMEGVRHEVTDDGKTKEIRDDMLGHRKLQVETRLKLLAKWDPTRYGDRNTVALTGSDGGPVQFSDTERSAKITAIMAAAQHRKGNDNSV